MKNNQFIAAQKGHRWVWTKLTESIHPERKAGDTLGVYEVHGTVPQYWVEKGWVEQKPENEIYAFRVVNDYDLQEGDTVIIERETGTYFETVSKHPVTNELCVYKSESNWDRIESLLGKYRLYKQNKNYKPSGIAYN
jgi:hypothetical protein